MVHGLGLGKMKIGSVDNNEAWQRANEERKGANREL